MANYSLSEVAKQLNCNESTIHRAVKKNKLNIKKVGNKRRFTSGNIAKLKALIRNKEVIKDNKKTQSYASTTHDNINDDITITLLKNQITDLKKDKENLNKQNEDLKKDKDIQIADFTRLLENQQKLMKQTLDKLEDRVVMLESPQAIKKKESLLHRIFNKKIF